MIKEEDLFLYFSDAIDSGELNFNETHKAAEFLEKYHFEKQDENGEEGVVIIDDIKTGKG